MYDRTKVDFKDKEHARAQTLDALYEQVNGALDDGFQPIQDIAVIAPAVWGFIDGIRQFIAEFYEREGRRPEVAEFAAAYGQAALMVARDQGFIPDV